MLRPVEDADRLARDAAALSAVRRLEEGMTIGLGSGRAVWRVIDLIGERWSDHPRPPLRAVFASEATRTRAVAAGIEVVELDGRSRLDMALDGTDEIDPRLDLIKGGGAALLREKLVIASAERFVVVAEARKRVERLGQTRPLPIEVVRFGWRDTRRRLLELMPSAELRTGPEGEAVVTDEGHHILDCAVPDHGDLAILADLVKATVGVVEHGFFLGFADTALLGTPDGAVQRLKR
jgi:ribose 5-phosphate isomerase A